MIKTEIVWASLLALALLSVSINTSTNTQSDCSSSANSYWTGYRCACKVGYKNSSNTCVTLTLLKIQGWIVREPAAEPQDKNSQVQHQTPVVNCYLPFEYYNGQGCVCLDKYSRVNGICKPIEDELQGTNEPNARTSCPENSVLTSTGCVCSSGFTLQDQLCIQTSSCGANSYDNGLGFCACRPGFYKETGGSCVAGTPCPSSSTRNAQGTCVCDAGLTMYEGNCARCPPGALFDQRTNRCVYVCGENSAYDNIAIRCVCLQGFAVYDQVCRRCPTNYIIQNKYCAACPVNSVYNQTSRTCDCSEGFRLSINGVCTRKCGSNQVYRPQTENCDCFTGLGRVGGVCQICQAGTTPGANGNCAACGLNQQLVDGKCICRRGFIPNQLNICTRCSDVTGAFLVNGACAVCPGDLIYRDLRCGCPLGQTKTGTSCRQTCKSDELIDENGLCYKCSVNEVISNGRCACINKYVRNPNNQICELTCPAPLFKYQGRCAQCSMNLQYRSQIRGCACADGYYINNNGVCEKVSVTPVTCDSGFYLDNSRGCTACTAGCRSCSSASVCTACALNGYNVVSGACITVCGDGAIAGNEQCDDTNSAGNDGCSASCLIESLWTCTGRPSVCIYNGPPVCGNGRVESGEECDDRNTVNNDGCNSRCKREVASNNDATKGFTLVGRVAANINSVFVVLKTDKVYNFDNEKEQENFIKTSFPGSTVIPTVYCTQKNAPEKDIFDCYILYNSGVPNKKFNIEFSYNFQGDSGFISVPVDPTSTPSATRSRNNRL